MLIPLQNLIKKYKLNLNGAGVLHVGASEGQEAEDYFKAGIEHVFWIEAIPEVYERLDNHTEKFDFKTCKLANALISDTDDDIVDFHIANNGGQSSSMLEFGTHAKEHPTVKYTRTIKLRTARIDTIFSSLTSNPDNDFNPYLYNFLNIDVQGAELLVLKSLGMYIEQFDYAYIEVNKAELYKGCPLVEEIDTFLSPYMARVETSWTGAGWGDAFYMKF